MFKEEKIRIKSAKDLICLIVDRLTGNEDLRNCILEKYEERIDAIIKKIKEDTITKGKSYQFELINNKLYHLTCEAYEEAEKELKGFIDFFLEFHDKLTSLYKVFDYLYADLKTVLHSFGTKLIHDKVNQLAIIMQVDENDIYAAEVHCNSLYGETINMLLQYIRDNLVILIDDNNFSKTKWKKERELLAIKKISKFELLFNSITFENLLDDYFKVVIDTYKSDLEDLQKHIDKIKFN